MSVKMRIMQTYDPAHEVEFLALEKEFAALERRRPDFPQGRRFKPVASSLCTHTLVWECEFKDLNAAHAALSCFSGDVEHEKLAEKQRPYFTEVRVEFLEEIESPAKPGGTPSGLSARPSASTTRDARAR